MYFHQKGAAQQKNVKSTQTCEHYSTHSTKPGSAVAAEPSANNCFQKTSLSSSNRSAYLRIEARTMAHYVVNTTKWEINK